MTIFYFGILGKSTMFILLKDIPINSKIRETESRSKNVHSVNRVNSVLLSFLFVSLYVVGSIYTLQGTEVHVLEVATNSSLCVRYIFNGKFKTWSFTLDRIMVQPGLKYQVSVSNLPKPDVGRHAEVRHITVADPTMGRLKVCLENGELHSASFIVILFFLCKYAEYQEASGTPTSPGQFQTITLMERRLPVPFYLLFLQIKPFFVRCMNNCLEYQQKVQIYSYMSSNDTTDMEEEKIHSIQRPSKVLIIYSLDHLLYKEIVLKLCAFLRARCGTDVMLDLLDFTQLSTIGSIQWLEMQRDRMSGSSDKVLILCSPGVYAKWRAMCGGNKVMTREDIQSPMGDMLTPALSLIIPDFVHASSYQKYIVAYFDDICSETDIPAPLNVAVKYQLMKHFEELFFRLVDKEKHEPGSIKQVEGIGGDDYFNSLQGIALKNAIEAFQAYQLANPNWFEMELVDTDVEIEPRGHKPDESADVACNCVLQNQLWVMDGAAPRATIFTVHAVFCLMCWSGLVE
uniref:SEFIR domain-containing protein n=1 Tax=Astyanax mexicanus TaxID=7994 RepID=W5K1G6_ASTMX